MIITTTNNIFTIIIITIIIITIITITITIYYD